MLFFIGFVLLTTISSTIPDDDRCLTLEEHYKKSFTSLVFTYNDSFHIESDKGASCHWLSGLKYQNKICRTPRGLAEALLRAKELSVTYCREVLKYEQWNCSIKDIFFQRVYRETAFMYSITSSAVMYSIARACSEGTLAGCRCGDPGKKSNSFSWGGCGDNVKYARRFTRKFFQLKKKGDQINTVLKYNIETGIKVVTQKEKKHCKCHGVSSSCSLKICWKKIDQFASIASKLKSLYFRAHRVEPTNDIKIYGKKKKKSQALFFLEDDIHYCPTTVDRICKDKNNCATLCCGRGNYTTVMTVLVKKYDWCQPYKVCLRAYTKNQTVYKCK